VRLHYYLDELQVCSTTAKGSLLLATASCTQFLRKQLHGPGRHSWRAPLPKSSPGSQSPQSQPPIPRDYWLRAACIAWRLTSIFTSRVHGVCAQMYSNINNASSAASDPSNCACFADYCPSTSPLLPAAIRPADPLSWDQAPLKINRPRPA
jgi:hypothetical protein